MNSRKNHINRGGAGASVDENNAWTLQGLIAGGPINCDFSEKVSHFFSSKNIPNYNFSPRYSYQLEPNFNGFSKPQTIAVQFYRSSEQTPTQSKFLRISEMFRT